MLSLSENYASEASATLGLPRKNLHSCPIYFRRTAYIALVRPMLEYGATVWNPYLKNSKDINRLECVQHQASRFITKNYQSREKGCLTKMLNDLEIWSLQIRWEDLAKARIRLLYNVAILDVASHSHRSRER